MSKLMELVEKEAQRAESEGGDGDDNDGGDNGDDDGDDGNESLDEVEGEEVVPADSILGAADLEPAYASIGPEEIRKAERARSAQQKKLAGILGEAAVAHECLLCAGLGFLPDLPPQGTVFSIVLTEEGPALLAEEPRHEPDFKTAADKQTCHECDGWGMVLTGAKSEHGRVAPCTLCSGNGWIMVAREQPAPIMAAPMPAPIPAPDFAAGNGLGPDAWGRPHGHQHWGVHPAQIPG